MIVLKKLTEYMICSIVPTKNSTDISACTSPMINTANSFESTSTRDENKQFRLEEPGTQT